MQQHVPEQKEQEEEKKKKKLQKKFSIKGNTHICWHFLSVKFKKINICVDIATQNKH